MPHTHLDHAPKHTHKHEIVQSSGPTLAKASSAGRRSIESLRNKHKGKEIWVLGTGPSMDDYPDNFFDDKVSIGVKANFKAFPNCTFFIVSIGYRKAQNFLGQKPESFKKFIFTMRTQSPFSPDWVPKKYRKQAIYMWDRRINVRRSDQAVLIIESIKRIKQKQSSSYPHDDNIAHLALQAAAIMGAKKITLVGCEDKGFYAERYRGFYSNKRYGPNVSSERLKKKWASGVRHRKANRLFAKALKRCGIRLALYHYKGSKQYKAGYLKLA